MEKLIIILDGEGEIPQGKRPEPILNSIKSLTVPHTIIDPKYDLTLERQLEKHRNEAGLAIVNSGETHVSGPRRYTSYAAQYYELVDDPEYKQNLREAVQAHHG